jgi:hypothetical protein
MGQVGLPGLSIFARSGPLVVAFVSCDLDACCCCSPRCLLKVSVRRPSSRESSYTGAQCSPSAVLRRSDPPRPPLLCRTRLHRVHSIRQRGRLSHQPPATARRTPLYSRASLNLVAAVSTSSSPAAVRPFDPKAPFLLHRQSLQEPAYSYAPALSQTPSRIRPNGTPICGTDAHDITTVVRFRLPICTV